MLTVLPPSSSPSLVKTPVSVSDPTLAKKIESRLLSSKVLADGIKVVLDSLRAVAEPETRKGDNDNASSGDDSGDSDGSIDSSDDEVEDAQPKQASKAKAKGPTLVDSDDDEDRLLAPHSSEDDSDSDGEMDVDADAAGWESGSIASTSHSATRPSKRSRATIATSSTIDSGSDSDSEDSGSESEEGIDPDALDDLEDNDDNDGGVQANESNRFLPSLQVGYTRGDSDAESWSGPEADIAGDKMRKNRRGQRARKA